MGIIRDRLPAAVTGHRCELPDLWGLSRGICVMGAISIRTCDGDNALSERVPSAWLSTTYAKTSAVRILVVYQTITQRVYAFVGNFPIDGLSTYILLYCLASRKFIIRRVIAIAILIVWTLCKGWLLPPRYFHFFLPAGKINDSGKCTALSFFGAVKQPWVNLTPGDKNIWG